MKNSKYLFVFWISVLLVSIFSDTMLLAKEYSSLSGTITDFATKQPLNRATIKVNETSLGAYSNKDGFYKINKIPKGHYSLLISLVGYETKKIDVQLSKDEEQLNIELKEQSIITNDVVVSANKKIQAVQEVPISISVIDNKFLEKKNITLNADFSDFDDFIDEQIKDSNEK